MSGTAKNGKLKPFLVKLMRFAIDTTTGRPFEQQLKFKIT